MNIAHEILKNSHFYEIAKELNKYILFQKRKKTTEVVLSNISNLQHHFQCFPLVQHPEKIYDTAAIDFFYRYGMANLIKNYYLVSELNQLGLLRSVGNIFDIGSGPGIFSLANLIWHIDNPTSCKKHHTITMIEPSKEFLNLFDALWEHVSAKEKKYFKIEKYPKLFDGSLPKSSAKPDLIIFSNSLLEILRDSRINQDKLFENLIESNAIIVIIDYLYDATSKFLKKFNNRLSPYFRDSSVYQWQYTKWEKSFFQSVNLNKIENKDFRSYRSSNIEFIKAILVPNEKATDLEASKALKLVNKYKQAWEHHDLRILCDLFTTQATYKEKKDRKPFDGISDICAYWKHNAELQGKVKFYPLFISEHNRDHLRCLWKSEFYREDLKHWLELRGEFIAKIDRNKISSFEETYKKIIKEKSDIASNQ